MFFDESVRDSGGYGYLGLQWLLFLIWFPRAYAWVQCVDRLDNNPCRHALNQTSQAAATILVPFEYLFDQAEHCTHVAHHDHRLTRPSICFFFLDKVPHLVQLHDANRLSLPCIRTQTLNIITKLLDPFLNNNMRYACQSPNATKANTLKIQTDAPDAGLSINPITTGLGVIATTGFAAISLFALHLAVFYRLGAGTFWTSHTSS